jgi:Mitochondrial carrier protein
MWRTHNSTKICSSLGLNKKPNKWFVNSACRYAVSVLGIIPYRGVYFGLYDTLREQNPFKDDLGVVGIASKFVSAQISAIAAGYASYPLDTVRRRLQMQVGCYSDARDEVGGTNCCFSQKNHQLNGFTMEPGIALPK